MTFVITQSCCGDASCVSVCPVNCIHPTPEEQRFATAEMLYIDPGSCIDCGLCLPECPVGAIVPDRELDARSAGYLRINADHYRDHDVSHGLSAPAQAPVLPARAHYRVALVGAGPSAFYVAAELLKHTGVRIDMFDRLPTPYGLVRTGVAPDHGATRRFEAVFAAVAGRSNFRYLLNITVGEHISHSELRRCYDAVVYAVGAPAARRPGIPGEDLPGSLSASDFAGWYNGHPAQAGLRPALSGPRAVIVGNGNVALDVARVLLTEPVDLAATDIADHALQALRDSRIEEVVILGRRGITQAAFTIGEFLGVGALPGVDVVIDPEELLLDDAARAAEAAGTLDSTITTRLRVAREFAARAPTSGNKRLVLRFLTAPHALHGEHSVTGIGVVRNDYASINGRRTVIPTHDHTTLDATLVVYAIGQRGVPLPGLPFDPALGIVPNAAGRVLTHPRGHRIPGVYVVGWCKRGATGGIGLNRRCAAETGAAVLADLDSGLLPRPRRSPDELLDLAARRGADPIDGRGWRRIDALERAAGARAGRPRRKLTDLDTLRAVAHNRAEALPHPTQE
ncbi:FAD-dependent oxidoreductase [Nocardia huaxiensis]|uniref:FAD-dependent oxidoreductase n=1 Tax=Nocardia huaxiensis TaxID=2755382 RepID=UPI001E356B0C|nr:FAD-dependent oxidoreductase [Nocardia huaxiensis]UFS97853.1 FAD-dependent oxidoreductase [Nocardia huaxiensis]